MQAQEPELLGEEGVGLLQHEGQQHHGQDEEDHYCYVERLSHLAGAHELGTGSHDLSTATAEDRHSSTIKI